PQGTHPGTFALSPDGSKVAVIHPPADVKENSVKAHLYIREVGTDGPETELGEAGMVAWSGDGSELAVCRFTDGKEPADIRATHAVYNLAKKEWTPIKLPEDHLLTDWSRDGRTFLTAKIGTERARPFVGVWLMNRDGSEGKRLSPDGQQVLLGKFS